MKITQEIDQHHYHIHGVDKKSIELSVPNPRDFPVVNIDGHVVVEKSFIISPNLLELNWPVTPDDELSAESFEIIDNLQQYEVIIIGTGQRIQFPSTEVLKPFISAGVGYEIMDSHAACRTYNVLCGEGRQVIAAIML